jgi:transposase
MTAYVARAAFPAGNPYLAVRDALGTFYDDERFATLFPQRGRPAEAPWRLALITVFQFAEGLADRQAADAVRGRIDWKYALGLELSDPGFDFSVLSEFRGRLLKGGAERLLLEAMLQTCAGHGLVKARTKQRTDSTHVLAAIRTLNRLELVGETLRAALNAVAVVAPQWLRSWVPAEWFDRYAARIEESRLPKAEEARRTLGERIGADGLRLLEAVSGTGAPPGLGALSAVDVLRRVWLVQFYVDEDHVRWRKGEDLPPSAQRIDSPYDPEATFSVKRSTAWTGYKVHLTETCEDDGVHLITNVETTAAVAADADQTAPIHGSLAARGLLPGDHLLDAGYVDAESLVEVRSEHGVRLVGPVRADVSWQAQAEGCFDSSHFAIDWEGRPATCPEGQTSVRWREGLDAWGNEAIRIEFARGACRACGRRALCTRAREAARVLTLRPRDQHEALQAARHEQQTAGWKAEYARRAGIEGTVSEGVRGYGLRRSRYIGQAKAHLQHVATAAAMNLSRLAAWLSEVPRAKTRVSRFARLALPA